MKCRKITGFTNYVVSKDGKVFSKIEDGYKELSPTENKGNKYKAVVLYKDGKAHYKYIHELVATAWVENPDGKNLVNHKDGDKSNHAASNLEFADNKENTQHAYDKGLAHGPKGEDNGKSKLTKGQVSSIKNSDKTGVKLSKLYGVTPAQISYIRNGKRW